MDGPGAEDTDHHSASFPPQLSHLRVAACLLRTAARVMRNDGFCCNRITILVGNEVGTVHMRSVLLDDIGFSCQAPAHVDVFDNALESIGFRSCVLK